MRNDVNVRKEHVEGLLPRSVSFPHLIKNNFRPFVFTPSFGREDGGSGGGPYSSPSIPSVPNEDNRKKLTVDFISSTTIDYLRKHLKNFMIVARLNTEKIGGEGEGSNQQSNHKAAATVATSTKSSYTSDSFEKSPAKGGEDQSWKTLSYYHWLTLFSYYNVSLYNRYVAILPQIDLCRIVKHVDVVRYRSLAEIRKYNMILGVDPETGRVVINTTSKEEQLSGVGDDYDKGEEEAWERTGKTKKTTSYTYKNALFELLGIVILGKFIGEVFIFSVIF